MSTSSLSTLLDAAPLGAAKVRVDLAAERAVAQVIAAGRVAAERGWVPATAGNFSVRAGARVAITRSGCDKGRLRAEDVAVVALDGPLPAGLSAEAPLHIARYRADASIGAIFHVHSHAAAIVSRRAAAHGAVTLQGWELQKAFAGVYDPAVTLRVTVFENRQDTANLAQQIEARLAAAGDGESAAPGYLLAGHGLYAWGATAGDAQRHLDAFDALLRLQLDWSHLR